MRIEDAPMKLLMLAGFIALTLLSCGKPDPVDQVRFYRQKYEIDTQWAHSAKTKDLTFEISVQNKSGGKNLQELTLVVEAVAVNDKVLWQEQIEFDVSGVGNFATETKLYKRNVDVEDIHDVKARLAPVGEDEKWKTYTEFMRIKRN